jgi:hypothetical protein
VAAIFDAFGTRQIGPARTLATGVPLALAVNARYALRRRRGRGGQPVDIGSPVGDQCLRVEPEQAGVGSEKAA